MDRHEPIDYDAYRRRAAELRSAAIADFIDAFAGWLAARFVRARELAGASSMTHRTPTTA